MTANATCSHLSRRVDPVALALTVTASAAPFPPCWKARQICTAHKTILGVRVCTGWAVVCVDKPARAGRISGRRVDRSLRERHMIACCISGLVSSPPSCWYGPPASYQVGRTMTGRIDMEHVSWFGCYDNGWQAAPLVAEAYAHPAKMSFGLAERIYRHMLAEGWLAPGQVVADPFGGIGGCAFHAALYGMHWRGVELEPKFVDLGNQNLALWRSRYAPHFPGYGSATLVQGDSRRLAAVLAEADAVVYQPAVCRHGTITRRNDPEQPGMQRRRKRSCQQMDSTMRAYRQHGYGSTPGNLGNLPAGDVDAVVCSPPYVAQATIDYKAERQQRRKCR